MLTLGHGCYFGGGGCGVLTALRGQMFFQFRLYYRFNHVGKKISHQGLFLSFLLLLLLLLQLLRLSTFS